MHAGDFGSYELTFLSTDIEQKVVDKVLEIMSSNMAALMQLTRSSHAQVFPSAFFMTACANSLSSHCGGMRSLQVQPRMC